MANGHTPDGERDRPERSARPAAGGSSRGASAAPGGSGAGRPDRPARSGGRPERGGRPEGGPGGGARREELERRTYDPRKEERRRAARVALPEEVDARMLDKEVRQELRSLSKESAELVARHLVVTGQLLDEDPETALAHARAARALAGRVAAVREACGLAAYAAGEWAEALTELRAARRISGSPEHLAVMADCERALGRPERALAYAGDPDVSRLEQDARVELVIVLSGARRDMGQADAAVLELQDPARRTKANRPWAVRLWYAYADALLGAGREADAREWFSAAADLDTDGQTDAVDRLLELDGVVFDGGDVEDDDLEDEEPSVGVPADLLPAAVKQARARAAAAPQEDAAPAPESEPEREPVAQPEPVEPPARVEAPLPPVEPPAPSRTPFVAPPAAPDLEAPVSERPQKQGEQIPGVSFQAPEDGDELRLFD